ncbi:response regulator [Agrobacterium tumefaciens]|uniref:hypothetical protein n=1 Tax=Agrobacterium tumefaciens TaxID=358 RepID=UPI00157253E6|nr:hypothetical protein [Agrobacterium tumefaciens]NSZ00649.1 response regulator [Agrobacterium tumefaciens]NSZ38143.1 response regulator [Agrobacterium tumefaciens]NTB25610.1 response regulator [Agrobacterium tumefaciens]NTB27047.1 response regulator [Agrobacterium tumefaciens]NTB32327.1 response regulator [Agrobacterium tumefaciens]
MTRKIRILLVEDAPAQVDAFNDAAEEWNRANSGSDREFTIINAATTKEAKTYIETLRLDCALVDIRLPADTGQQARHSNGNELIKSLLVQRGMPIGIISGVMSELDNDVSGKAHVKQFDKGDTDTAEKAIGWLGENWSMMETLDKVRHRMELAGAEIFGKRLWPQWSSLPSLDQDLVVAIVARQYASHLVDKLGLDHPENIEWHPFEAYVKPSMNDSRAHTGDIFKLENDTLWVVVSPQCDMATRKVESAVLCLCTPGYESWEGQVTKSNNAGLEAAARKKAQDWIRKRTNQEVAVSDHFMPPLPGQYEPLIVKFGTLRTIALSDLNKPEYLVKREAAVSSPFLSNLVQRFGAYISRTGQPNLNPESFHGAPNPGPS